MLAALAMAAALTVAPTQPDETFTPGVWRDISVTEICATKWGKDHRAVDGNMKLMTFRRYGFSGNDDVRCTPPTGKQRCEIDHRRPRELGGADALANLWVEAYFGPWNAHDKDRLENYAHDRVCAPVNAMPLDEARAMFEGDWHAAYIKAFGGPPQSASETK